MKDEVKSGLSEVDVTRFAKLVKPSPAREGLTQALLSKKQVPLSLMIAGRINPVAREEKFPDYNCYSYVFRVVKSESWEFGDRMVFWIDPILWFECRGYKPIVLPRDGDVVGYACNSASEANRPEDNNDTFTIGMNKYAEPPYFSHVGVFRSNRVVSKFGRGGVYFHDLDMVPTFYGNQAYFFRKQSQVRTS